MKIIKDPKQLDHLLACERACGKSIGFVPTMGALHAGHLSLVKASNRENDLTVVSIFVNPTQFGPNEDYKKYPRTLEADKKKLKRFKVDYLFCPTIRTMYPHGYAISVKVSPLSKILCGKFRPGHFQGVVTVVARLLDIVKPSRLYLGAKDYQQAVIIRQLIRDLGMKVRVCIMPTVREKDGLAMSSRNRYLNAGERRHARMISKILFKLRRNILKKKIPLNTFKTQALQKLKEHTDGVQYLEIVDPVTLASVKRRQSSMVAMTACFVGKTRLIDNVIMPLSGTGK